MSLVQVAVTLFLIMDPLGNIPAFLALLRGIPAPRQKLIILRELLIALAVILLFSFLGDEILSGIGISHSTVQLGGGVILFLIALQMIFPSDPHTGKLRPREEPFVVPLAIPLIAGPSIIATVMVFAHKESHFFKTTSAILLAWLATTFILLLAPWLQRKVGDRVLVASERLMGLVMTIFAVDMFTSGIKTFLGA